MKAPATAGPINRPRLKVAEPSAMAADRSFFGTKALTIDKRAGPLNASSDPKITVRTTSPSMVIKSIQTRKANKAERAIASQRVLFSLPPVGLIDCKSWTGAIACPSTFS